MEPSHQGGSFVSISVRGKNVKAKRAQTPLEYTVNIKKVFSSLLDLTTLAVAAVLFVKNVMLMKTTIHYPQQLYSTS